MSLTMLLAGGGGQRQIVAYRGYQLLVAVLLSGWAQMMTMQWKEFEWTIIYHGNTIANHITSLKYK